MFFVSSQHGCDGLECSDLRGCGSGLHPGGVAVTGPYSEKPIQKSDAGELPEPGRSRVSTIET